MKQKIKIAARSLVFRVCFASLLLFFIADVCIGKSIAIPNFKPPAKEDVIWMESFSVEELQINFLEKTTPGHLGGRIVHLPKDQAIGSIHYAIKSAGGAILWEKESSATELDKYGGLPFSLFLEALTLSEGSTLSVDIYNEKNTLIAQGARGVVLQEFVILPEISDLSLVLKKDIGIARFVLDNKSPEAVVLEPNVEIFDREEKHNLGNYRSDFVEIGAGEKKAFEVEFARPSDPQVYIIKAFFKAKEGHMIGGVLKKNFLIEGDFAQIKRFELIEADVKAKTINFAFSGATRQGKDLEIAINLSQEWEGTVVDTLSKSMKMKADRRGRFKGSLEMTLEEDADYFVADLLVKDGANIIGKSHLEKALLIAPRLAGAIDEQKDAQKREVVVKKVKWWMKKDWLVWGGILLFLILFATNNWLRLHKKVLRILLFSFLLSDIALAQAPIWSSTGSSANGADPQVWWRHPVVSWYFNPRAADEAAPPTAGFAHFAKVRFKGEVLSGLTLNTDPLFAGSTPGDPDVKPKPIVLIELKKGSLSDWISVDPGDISHNFNPNTTTADYLSVEDSVRFEFEVNTADPTDGPTLIGGTPLKDFLTDGTWKYTVYFCMGGNNYSCDGGLWYASSPRDLLMDSSKPVLSRLYDGDANQRLHLPQIQGFVTQLASKFTSRDEKLNQKRSKTQEKEEKDVLMKKKIAMRTEKLWRIDELNNSITILNARLHLVNLSLADSYLPDTERGQLETQKANLESSIASAQAEIVTLNNEITSLNDHPTEGITILGTDISTLTSEITALDGVITTLEADIDGLQTNIEGVRVKSKNGSVQLAAGCDDATGVGCLNPNYQVLVNGNFCGDNTICDNTGARKMKICDMVGNCIDETLNVNKNEIDWYDVVPPEATVDVRNDANENGIVESSEHFTSGKMKAGEVLSFALLGTSDLRRKDASTLGPTLSENYNPNACGANGNSPLFEDTANYPGICLEKIVNCAVSAVKRGRQKVVSGGGCVGLCDAGYIYNNGICYLDCDQRNLDICLPGILGRGECPTADAQAWTPDPATKPIGIPFMQENGCGNRRQVIGTQP